MPLMATQAKIEYWVYENHHNEYARGDTNACLDFKKQQGLNLATGQWHGPYQSKTLAMAKGSSLPVPFRWCKKC